VADAEAEKGGGGGERKKVHPSTGYNNFFAREKYRQSLAYGIL